MKKSTESKVKKSVILSGLVSTGGLFFAKMIGLLYSIPFSYILANDAYTSIYGGAFRIYSYLLNVFTAGFPFAISTLVAKYSVRDDPKAVLRIQKISKRVLSLLGALGMVIMLIISPFLAPVMANGEYVPIMRNSLFILSIAIFLVPVLASYRGVIQGRKEMGEYAFSQTFEQIFRVGFLLGWACLVIFVFHIDRVWALYGAVLSTSIAAAAGVWQIVHFEKKNMQDLQIQAKKKKTRFSSNYLMRELITIAIPYFFVAIIGYASDIFDAVLLPIGLKYSGISAAEMATTTSVVNYAGTKLTAIPMILSPGFTAALIPHLSEAMEVKNFEQVRKNVLDCLNIVIFIALPVCALIFIYVRPIFNILFYTDNIDLACSVTRWICIEGFCYTVTPLLTNLLMALQLRKEGIRYLTIATIAKLILMIPFIAWWGMAGSVASTLVMCGYYGVMAFILMKKRFKISYKPILINSLLTIVCILATAVVAFGLTRLGLDGGTGGKLIAFAKLCLNGLISVVVFTGFACLFRLPQNILHINIDGFLDR